MNPTSEAEFWRQARQVRDELAAQFLTRPEVVFIDIGYVAKDDNQERQIAVRIHVRRDPKTTAPESPFPYPKQVGKIPVVVLFGEYREE